MAAIAITMLPEFTAYNSTSRLARALLARGHDVVFTGPTSFEELLKSRGFKYIALHEGERDAVALSGGGPRTGDASPRDRIAARFAAEIEVFESTRAWLRRSAVDLVISDPLLPPGYVYPFLEIGTPLILASSTLSGPATSLYRPVFSNDVPKSPQPGVLDRLVNRSAWLALGLRNFVAHRVRFALADTAAKHGLPSWRDVQRMGARTALGEYGRRLMAPEIVLGPKELDFPQNVAARGDVYAGHCVDEARKDQDEGLASVDWEGPVVYCAIGTYGAGDTVARRALEAVIKVFRRRGDFGLILQHGGALSQAECASMPCHIRCFRFVPQLEALSRADFFITHGGFGSLKEAAFYGVPMLVMPRWLDQCGNAARVLFHRIGVRCRPHELTGQAVEEKFLELSSDATFRDRASEMQTAIRKGDELEEIAQRVEHVLANA